MASSAEPDRGELVQLTVLLALVAGFYFVVIPLGIPDPEGFSLDGGLPPSFSARLAAVLAALVVVVRFARLVMMALRHPKTSTVGVSPTSDLPEAPSLLSGRIRVAVALSLLFALGLIPLLGFLLASVLTLSALMALLGERRRAAILAYPLLVVCGVWLLFGYLLSVRLPPGWLVPWLLGSS